MKYLAGKTDLGITIWVW